MRRITNAGRGIIPADCMLALLQERAGRQVMRWIGVVLGLAIGWAAGAVAAAPRLYEVVAAESEVNFSWDFGQDEIRGTMPVARADLAIDFGDLAASTVDVAVDVRGAEAGFDFATQGMLGPTVLDAANWPLIEFRSADVRRTGPGKADLHGEITVRGVTRPMVFAAEIYRAQGSAEGDFSTLVVLLTGALSRSAFGADGWADMAGDEVRLRIRATLEERG
jgi:polyisoprenoid-binding protein YceI